MSGCDHRCVPIPLPDGWGDAVLHAATHLPGSDRTYRSYDALGRQLVWRPSSGARFACDVEGEATSAPGLARRFGCEGPELLRRWIITETLAKLTDTPVLAYLRDRGLALADGDADGPILEYRAGPIEVLLRHVPTDRGEAFAAFGRAVAAGRGHAP